MKNKKIIYLLSFMIPILVLIVVLFIKGIGFNAEKILVSDSHSQYVTLFLYLKRILNGTESLFYSFNNGLGGSMYATFAYYLASPLNLLLIFFNENNIPEFVMLILFIKVGLCGLTMNIYINKHFNLKFESLIFSCCYALMAYVINYYFNIMWLDGVYLLPLVMLGIDKLLKENKFLLYIISLFLAIFSNFYIGYMICIFSCIYFIQELLLNYKKTEYKKKIFNFIKYSILAGLLASFLLMPTFMEIMNFSRHNLKEIQIDGFESLYMLVTNFYVGAHHSSNLYNVYGTFLYCGLFPIMNFILFYFNKNIKYKERLISFIIFSFLIASCLFFNLKCLWHGFSYPNAFNNRFSFIISFYIIFMAINNYKNKDINSKKILAIVIGYFCVGCIILSIRNYYCFKIPQVLLSIIFILIYYIIFKFIKLKYQNIVIFLFVIIELFLNTIVSFNYVKQFQLYDDVSTIFCPKIQKLNLEYRMDTNYLYGSIDGLLCGYSGITKFLSSNTIGEYLINKKLGYSVNSIQYVNELGNTPIADSLIGIKYLVDKNNNYKYSNIGKIPINYYDGNEYYKINLKIYENSNALKIGYVIKNDNIEFKNNNFDFQNEIIKKFSGIDKEPLIKINNNKINTFNYEIDNVGGTIYFKINYDSIYTYYSSKIFDVYVNGEKLAGENYSIFNYKNDLNKNIKIEIAMDKNSIFNILNIDSYLFDDDTFKEQIDILKQNQIENIKKEKNIVKFNINILEDDSILFLSIPYSKNWKIYDNNKKISYDKILDNFITIKLKKGNHNIKMIYEPAYFKISILISIISLIIILMNVKKEFKHEK